jgi:hypothetical protein
MTIGGEDAPRTTDDKYVRRVLSTGVNGIDPTQRSITWSPSSMKVDVEPEVWTLTYEN